MEMEYEQGDEEEEPGRNEEEESDSEESGRLPAGKNSEQTGSDDDSDAMSWTAQVEVTPRMPSPDKADLVKVFNGVMGFSIETIKLLVVEQGLQSCRLLGISVSHVSYSIQESETHYVESQETPCVL